AALPRSQGTGALRQVRGVRRGAGRDARGRDRDRRGLEPRHRGDPDAPREREVHAGPRALQGLHHRRGSPAHRGGVQRAAEDAGGAATAHRVRARHDRPARDGEDLLAFARDVIELLRLTLVLKAAPNAKPAELTHSEGNELRKLGEAVSLDEILYALRALLEADALMRESPHPRVELEIATVRATRRPVPQALEDVLKRVDEAQRELRQQALSTPSTAAPT